MLYSRAHRDHFACSSEESVLHHFPFTDHICFVDKFTNDFESTYMVSPSPLARYASAYVNCAKRYNINTFKAVLSIWYYFRSLVFYNLDLFLWVDIKTSLGFASFQLKRKI